MRISLDDLQSLPLKRLPISFNEKLDIEDLVKPVVGDLLVQSSAGGVVVTGRVTTLLKLNCHVCLRPYFQSLTIDIDEQFASNTAYSGETTSRERELTRDDFFEVLPADGTLDITDIVYQAVTLASPVFCRCGSECPGPPVAGNALVGGDSDVKSDVPPSDMPIDPRWENLKTLFSKRETGENS